MATTGRLTPHEREHFTDIVEASLRVIERRQYFSWLQGIMQSLLPHEVVISGAGAVPALEYMSSTLEFDESGFRVACIDRTGVVARLVEQWRRTAAPCVLAGNFDDPARGPQPSGETGLGNVVLHGVLAPSGEIMGCYAFGRVPAYAMTDRLAFLLELLVPTVHHAFVRVLAHDARSRAAPGRLLARPITAREVEILGWIKEGKTNADIARILSVSPWTVKNHVHALLRKLGAQRRSHAVARAMSMGLLDLDAGSRFP
jgi:transcriptional regulator EpsA